MDYNKLYKMKYRIIENIIDTADGKVKTYNIQRKYKFLWMNFWFNYYPYVKRENSNDIIQCPSFKIYNDKINHIYNSLEFVEFLLDKLNKNDKPIIYCLNKIEEVYSAVYDRHYNEGKISLITEIKYFISTKEQWLDDAKKFHYAAIYNSIDDAKKYIDRTLPETKSNRTTKKVYERKTI